MSWTLYRSILKPIIPSLVAKRLRSKINIQKPKPPHHLKATFLALTQPRFISPNLYKKQIDLCDKNVVEDKEVDNPFQRIIAEELFRWFKSSRLIAFYHMNPMSADQQFKAYAQFKKESMHFQVYGKATMEMAIKNTPYEAALSLYVSRNVTVFSPKPEIKTLLRVSKKYPQITLLAAILEGKFISKDELVEYSLIPDLQTAQANLVHTLNSIGTNIVEQLNMHQNVLVCNLEERMKQLKE
ncbi:hypothetical protein FQA39_LY11312 [Lamprigera yunnana]|nr:hypothetical protein FQA39_LY11312 [Lamprigera yunnana]